MNGRVKSQFPKENLIFSTQVSIFAARSHKNNPEHFFALNVRSCRYFAHASGNGHNPQE